MEYLKTQKNDIQVSRMGLGCMRMSMSNHPADEQESISTIHAALDSGINFLNTGDFYGIGHNESLIGRAIKDYDRDKAFISVKFGGLLGPNGLPYGIDSRPLAIKNYLTYSLKRLGVDYIDLYEPGRLDPEIPVEETLGPIAEMVKEGYIRHIGLTEVDAETLRRAHAVHPISLVEQEYSLFKRNIEKELLPTARELGIGVVAFGILSHGLISKERIEEMKKRPAFPGMNLDKNLLLLETVNEIAEEKQITVPQLLTAWVLTQGEDIMPLIGARKVSQFEESMKALDVKLNEIDLERINKAFPADTNGDDGHVFKFKNGLIVR
ncbi:aldo/keto reductase [Saccharibacillus endophyticus]|uniref:Oxidoreductase n=1 Tax=Saccharibacillus endophyticus TaxID=2060666 RepID=A0ABQ1ZW04_9BACL|nr:aldo/keto reductase [Saccharibacillus endophyticus]GGH80773.1 oxidoreductase [Saccharibacillus endophyticus]